MAIQSGRSNEFKDDAHFWTEDPILERAVPWTAPPSRNERIMTSNGYPLYINLNGRQYKMPVTIPQTEE